MKAGGLHGTKLHCIVKSYCKHLGIDMDGLHVVLYNTRHCMIDRHLDVRVYERAWLPDV
jgi:hypothetical protein